MEHSSISPLTDTPAPRITKVELWQSTRYLRVNSRTVPKSPIDRDIYTILSDEHLAVRLYKPRLWLDNYHVIVNDLCMMTRNCRAKSLTTRLYSFPRLDPRSKFTPCFFSSGSGRIHRICRAELSLIISHDKRTTNNGRFLNLKKM